MNNGTENGSWSNLVEDELMKSFHRSVHESSLVSSKATRSDCILITPEEVCGPYFPRVSSRLLLDIYSAMIS